MSIYDPNWETDKLDKSDIDGFTMSNIYYSTPMMEYNMFMTIFYTFKEIINELAEDYGLDWDINIIPEFPKDLTKVKYPSVCIREAGIDKTALYLGTPIVIEDNSVGAILDSMNRKHTMNVQFDAVSKTNTERLKLKSLIDETLARMGSFGLLNFSGAKNKSYMLPTAFGEKIKSDGDIFSTNITVDTLQYVGVTRLRFSCVEIIIPRDNNDIVDLSILRLIHDDYLDKDKDHSVTEHNLTNSRSQQNP